MSGTRWPCDVGHGDQHFTGLNVLTVRQGRLQYAVISPLLSSFKYSHVFPTFKQNRIWKPALTPGPSRGATPGPRARRLYSGLSHPAPPFLPQRPPTLRLRRSPGRCAVAWRGSLRPPPPHPSQPRPYPRACPQSANLHPRPTSTPILRGVGVALLFPAQLRLRDRSASR